MTEQLRATLLERITQASLASCTCLAISQETCFHKPNCRYHVLTECFSVIETQELVLIEKEVEIANLKHDMEHLVATDSEHLADLAAANAKIAELEAKCARLEDALEMLSTCEICGRDLVTPNPDGSLHNCVCLACWNRVIERALKAEADAKAMREALTELVRLKDIKEWLEAKLPPYDPETFVQRNTDYHSNKAAAWDAARNALAPTESGKEKQ